MERNTYTSSFDRTRHRIVLAFGICTMGLGAGLLVFSLVDPYFWMDLFNDGDGNIVGWLLSGFAMFIGFGALVFWFGARNCELILAQGSVWGNAMFSRPVSVPVEQIRSVRQGKWLCRLTTSSGTICFALLKRIDHLPGMLGLEK